MEIQGKAITFAHACTFSAPPSCRAAPQSRGVRDGKQNLPLHKPAGRPLPHQRAHPRGHVGDLAEP